MEKAEESNTDDVKLGEGEKTDIKDASVASTVKSEFLDRLVCPLCRKTYKVPRCLSCMHSFCEKCIQAYIVEQKEQDIECPVCKQLTSPSDPGKRHEVWAQALPINSCVVPLIASLNSEGRSPNNLCDVCKVKDISDSMVLLCIDCQKLQCEDCVVVHESIGALRDHTLVPLKFAKASQSVLVDVGKVDYCQIHAGKRVEVLCEKHGTFCCGLCAANDHAGCQNQKPIKDLGKAMKAAGKPKQLQAQIKGLQNQLHELIEDVETGTTAIEKQVESLPKQIAEIQAKINKTLDELKQKVRLEGKRLSSQNWETMSERIRRCKTLLAATEGSSQTIDTLQKYGSEIQAYIAHKKLEGQVKLYWEAVMNETYTTNNLELHLDIDESLQAVSNATKSLAEVSMGRSKEKKVSFKDSIPITKSKLHTLPAVRLQRRDGMMPVFYTGVLFLPDGRLVALDWKNSLCCLLDSSFMYRVKVDVVLPARPTNIALIGDKEVAVVMHKREEIQCLYIGQGEIAFTRTIPCSHSPVCLARVSESELAVGWRSGFGLITLAGLEKLYLERDSVGRRIHFSNLSDSIAVDTTRSRVYQTHQANNALYCFSFSGEALFTYKHDQLKCPVGVALDRDCNVYVCSCDNSKVHQVSRSGELIKVIDIQMESPYAICFNPDGNWFVVTNSSKSGNMIQSFMFKPT